MKKARRSEFARHFGPAALRREVRARYGIDAEPRRVTREELDPLRNALAPVGLPYGCVRLVAAWAAHVEADPGVWVDKQGAARRSPSDIYCVCALWAGGGPARVAWGAVRVGTPPTHAHVVGNAGSLYVGRATGPTFRAFAAPSDPVGSALVLRGLPSYLYATNDAVECPTCRVGCPIASRSAAWGFPYPCSAYIAAHEDADRYVCAMHRFVPGLLGPISMRASEHLPFRGLRRRRGCVLPPRRLAAGRAHYRDAPALAAATALLGRRAPAAHRFSYERETV